MEEKAKEMKSLTGFEVKRKKALSLSFFVLAGLSAYAQIAIPGEVQSTLESVRDAFTGDIARTIIGICFAGSCIAYAYNKDNEKMKGKLIAVMIGSGLLALSQTIVDSVTSMGT